MLGICPVDKRSYYKPQWHWELETSSTTLEKHSGMFKRAGIIQISSWRVHNYVENMSLFITDMEKCSHQVKTIYTSIYIWPSGRKLINSFLLKKIILLFTNPVVMFVIKMYFKNSSWCTVFYPVFLTICACRWPISFSW